ncbi:MAG: sulfatase [Chitinophagales bacterium]|nr:sulfatase [Chitinophagales bacterium]
MKRTGIILLLLATFCVHAQKKPNIVIIISDDHAYQTISAYGSKLMNTPNIDRIAKEGVLFNKAFVTNSICGPSRAVILTGKYSHKNGFKDNENSVFDGNQNSFIKELTRSGYNTAWIGKWHLESIPQGFSYYNILQGQGWYYNSDFITEKEGKHVKMGYVTNVVEEEVEKWLDERDTTKPFCLIIGHKNTHRVWIPDFRDMGEFDDREFPLPPTFYDDYKGREAAKIQEMSIDKDMILGYDLKVWDDKEAEDRDGSVKRMTPEQRAQYDAYYDKIKRDFHSKNLSGRALAEWKFQRYMKDYLATARSLDRNIGRTLNYLDIHKLNENTLVIYISDQGFYMGEHGWFDKRFMYEESFKTAFLMRYPGVIKPGTVSETFVMNLDIGPTVLDAAGVKIPGDMQGRSLLPLFKNKFRRDAVFYHYYEKGEHNVSPHFGIRTKRYKLIRFYDKVNSWELYDLKKDKWEINNLYGNKKYSRKIAGLKHKLKNLIIEYDDQDAMKIFEMPIP